MDNCLIFDSRPPRYSKTRWRAFAYAYSSAFTFDKDKKNRKFCPAVFALMLVLCTSSLRCAWAYVCAVGVLNTFVLMPLHMSK